MFLVIVIAGCNSDLDKVRQDNLSEGEQVYVGYLSKDIMQHPIVDINKEQDCLDVYEGDEKIGQVILVYNEGVEPISDYGKLIMVTGEVDSFGSNDDLSIKKPRGTVMYVKSWRYIE
jgi:hypothetical protein